MPDGNVPRIPGQLKETLFSNEGLSIGARFMETPRVLMVDDEKEFLDALVKLLRRRNMNVTGAASGKEALDRLKTEPVDVVILDFMMPGMSGIETLKEMKRGWPDVEGIMLTAVGSVESGLEGMRSGAFDYILKPAEIDDLIAKVSQAYERKVLSERKREGIQ
jgi:DNA-binding response OmpR family regulator